MSADYVDITEVLFGSIPPDATRLVKSDLFDLLGGTRAIEVTNPRLDTGLIPLTNDDVTFDVKAPISEDQLVGVMSKLVILLSSWLKHSSLPLTVMSCRYVQHILEAYSKSFKRSSIQDLFFANLGVNEGSSAGSLEQSLTNKVLRSYVIGLCKFVGVCITVGLNVLYEEEDITTRAMDLSFLVEVSIDEVLDDIQSSIAWCQQEKIERKDVIIEHLKFIIALNKLPIMFNLRIDLFEETNEFPYFTQAVSEAMQQVDYFRSYDYSGCEAPAGCFSKYVQATLDNRNIPGDIVMIDENEALDEIGSMLAEILLLFNKSRALQDFGELENFLTYDVELRDKEFNAITRGFFQLFLLRDDQTIMGAKYTLSAITHDAMVNLNLHSTTYLTKTYNLPADKTEQIETSVNGLVRDVESLVYQSLINKANNKSRQRQILNKNILLWDTLQANAERFEVDLFEKYKINDKFNESNDLTLPITSFIYKTKLDLMIEYLLKGFELDLYKEFEVFSVYWYTNYLISSVVDIMETRILKLNKYKLQQLTNKKKKAKNKADIERRRQELIVIIGNNELRLQYYKALSSLVRSICNYLLYMHQQKVVSLTQLPSTFYDSSQGYFNKLFNLRFKCFESIGVPAALTFSQYLSTIAQTKHLTKMSLLKEFSDAEKQMTAVAAQIQYPKFKDWAQSLAKTSLVYQSSIDSMPSSGKMVIVKGVNCYFPKISIVNS